MRIIRFELPAFLCAMGSLVAGEAETSFGVEGSRPNILLILADDLAWSDLGCYGHPWHETPHLDSLAGDGLGFTDGYAPAPICSASRASILTGKSPARLGFEFVTKNRAGRQALNPRVPLEAPPYTLNLPLKERTMGEMLGDAGYTTGWFGKWHLNAHYRRYLGWSPTHGPKRQGFATAEDTFGSHPYAYRGQKPPAEISGKGIYPRDALTEKAVRFLKLGHRRPFFVILSHYYVHTPVDTAATWLIEKYHERIPPEAPNRNQRISYAAFVETLDHYVGELLEGLRDAGKAGETLVVFTSDNGGHPEYASNAPLRGSKWNLYEGGIRVPFLLRWPGRVPEGTVCREPVCGYDLYPTFAELAGKPVTAEKVLDGRSLIPLFRNPGQQLDRVLYWHFPYYHPEGRKFAAARPEIGMNDFAVSQTHPVSALRSGHDKLLYFHEDRRVELYDLHSDPGETRDLSGASPEKAAALNNNLQAILKAVGARMPRRVIVRQ
ncbi:MAG: arylsulfatase [Verrucomicrobiaceae bacterium]|nr:arylsulfatase [Verrucomicrobiaceae bacterium]